MSNLEYNEKKNPQSKQKKNPKIMKIIKEPQGQLQGYRHFYCRGVRRRRKETEQENKNLFENIKTEIFPNVEKEICIQV